MTPSASPSSVMSRRTKFNQHISSETWEYYRNVSEGLIKERSYDDWGPETEEEKMYRDRPELPIQESFQTVHWDSSFSGRGSKLSNFLIGMSLWKVNKGIVLEDSENTIERPGLVGPKGEMLMRSVDPESNEAVYWVDDGTAPQPRVYSWLKRKKRSSLEAANKVCKLFKDRVVGFFELSRMTKTMGPNWSDDRYNL